jgi:hypothetical protein
MDIKLNKILKKINVTSDGFNLLPWLIFVISIIIIIIYLIKIEIHSNGTKWELNKCSTKYVFFSGFLNREGESNPLLKTMNNFKDCIKRFS